MRGRLRRRRPASPTRSGSHNSEGRTGGSDEAPTSNPAPQRAPITKAAPRTTGGRLPHERRRGRGDGDAAPDDDEASPHEASSDQEAPPPGRVRPSLFPAAVGVALVLVGVGAFLVGTAADTAPEARLLGGNLPVNEGAGGQGDISGHNSPTVATDPTDPANVVIANRLDMPDFSCAMHLSSDGGASFEQRSIPVPEDAGDDATCYAPDVVFDDAGTLHLLFVTLTGGGNRPTGVWLASSNDGGRTLSDAQRLEVVENREFAFQTGLVADPDEPGKLYLTWLAADATGSLAFPETGYPIMFAASDDGGDSWSEPQRVSAPDRERVVAPTLAVGTEDALHVAYLDLGEDRLDWSGAHSGVGGPPYQGTWQLVSATSRDGGQSWQESAIGEVRPFERIIVFLPDYPSLVVDRDSGRVYAAFHSRRDGDADVMVWRSPDGAQTWRDPVRVNATPSDDGTAQYLPQLDVAPTGRVDVVYYDRRDDPDNVMNEVSLAWSADGGASFRDRLVVSDEAFDSQIGFNAVNDLAEIGSRLGLRSRADRAMPVWTDTRAGTPASGKQDLVRQVVGFSGEAVLPPPVPAALRYGGAGAALVGGAVLAWWLVRAWRGRSRHGEAEAAKSHEESPAQTAT